MELQDVREIQDNAALIPQVVNQVLSDLNSDPKCSGNFLLVRLNGWMHTDDRLAMLDIAAQLDTAAQLDLEEKLKTSTNVRERSFVIGRGLKTCLPIASLLSV